MITLEPIRGSAWIFRAVVGDTNSTMPDYICSGVIEADGDCAIIKGVSGHVTRRIWREVIFDACQKLGFRRVRYFRRAKRLAEDGSFIHHDYGRWIEYEIDTP